MDSVSYRPGGYQPGSPRERAVASALSLGIILLIVLALVFSAIVDVPERIRRASMTSFSFDTEDPTRTARSQRSRPKAPHAASRRTEQTTTTRPKPIITIQKQVERPDAEAGIPGFIHMSSADMAASDIGKLKGPKGSDSNGKGTDSRTAYGPGEGPGGVRLLRPDWHRVPTYAELSRYWPVEQKDETYEGARVSVQSLKSGRGLLACRTAEHYHVEDCQIIDEFPHGAGIGRAVLNASWQFLINPPKQNGIPEIGIGIEVLVEVGDSGQIATK